MNLKLGIKEENMMVLGWSMGGAPATYIASKFNPFSQILMSAFTSIREVALDKTRWGHFVSERFNNLEQIDKVKCPTLIIHGKQDKIINVLHAKRLYHKCCAIRKVLVTPEESGHNLFNQQEDILNNIFTFLHTSISFNPVKQKEQVPVDKLSKLRIENFDAPPEPKKKSWFNFQKKPEEKVLGNLVDQ